MAFDAIKGMRMEDALRITNERLAVAATSADIGVWDYDLSRNQIAWDDRLYRLYGRSRGDPSFDPTRDWRNCIHSDDIARVDLELQSIVAEKDTFSLEFRVCWPNGELRDVRATGQVLRDSSGTALRIIGANLDITERNRYVGELKRAQGRLEELNIILQERTRQAEAGSVAKTLFLANMSHEIRTPLSAVIGLTHLLGQTTLDGEQAAFVDKIGVASRSLLGTINDVLDLSKIEAGEMHVEDAEFDPQRLIAELVSVMTVQAQAKQIALDVALDAELPTAVSGDATRINQILTNLVSNAIKFTVRGAVSLSVSVVERSTSSVFVCFSVRDTGIGMAPEMTERLFLPFTQADTSTTRKFGGTGLGLSIVKRLCALLDGKINVTSKPGRGSEFTVTLPLRLKEAQPSHATEQSLANVAEALPGLIAMHVLVADDSELNLEIAQRMLVRAGAAVTLARNGAEAVDSLSRSPTRYHAVLMDVHMPVLDGLGATRRIRNIPGLSDLPIIAVTAGALLSEHQRALEAGMNDFITKPFDPQTMIAVLRRHLPNNLNTLTSSPPTTATPPPPEWPALEGMAASETYLLLGGDRQLFTQLLQHLFEQLEALESSATNGCNLAARLHKLTGSAAMLGAHALQRASSEAERLAHLDPAEGQRATALTVVPQLRRLRESARQLVAAIAPPAQRPSSEPTHAASELQALIDLLTHRRIDALDAFLAAAPLLQHELGQGTFAELDRAINSLQYRRALQILDPLRRTCPKQSRLGI